MDVNGRDPSGLNVLGTKARTWKEFFWRPNKDWGKPGYDADKGLAESVHEGIEYAVNEDLFADEDFSKAYSDSFDAHNSAYGTLTAVAGAGPWLALTAPAASAAYTLAGEASLKGFVILQTTKAGTVILKGTSVLATVTSASHLYNCATDDEYLAQTLSIDSGVGVSSIMMSADHLYGQTKGFYNKVIRLIKRAERYLNDVGVKTYLKVIKRSDWKSYYDSFKSGTVRLKFSFKGGQSLYRSANSVGAATYGEFAAIQRPISPVDSILKNALHPTVTGNRARFLYGVSTRRGFYLEGIVAPQGSFSGGNTQIFQPKLFGKSPWKFIEYIGY